MEEHAQWSEKVTLVTVRMNILATNAKVRIILRSCYVGNDCDEGHYCIVTSGQLLVSFHSVKQRNQNIVIACCQSHNLLCVMSFI